MEIILNGLLYLAILIIINIALGMYHNIGQQEMKFELKWLFDGLVKGGIIAGSFVGLAYVFANTDLSAIGIAPETIMNASLILYATKAINNLMKILGVEV